MKITLSNNIDNIGCAMEGMPDELIKTVETFEKFKDTMRQAGEAAQYIFKNFPQFRQVTFDTMTNEDRDTIDRAKDQAEKGGPS